MKQGIRILALATAPIQKKRRTLLVGVVGREGVVEGVVSTTIAVDGGDSSGKIARLFNRSRFNDQVRLIVMNGAALAGLNMVDYNELESRTGVKVASVTRTKPHPSQLAAAIRRNGKLVRERLALISEFKRLKHYKAEGFYIQSNAEIGALAKESIALLRMAHMIARGVSTGESKGRV
jgi:hypothetical protein